MSQPQPLTQEQILFNQRLLAAHCLSEEDAEAVWSSLSDEDMKANIAQINTQMVKVGLEIRGLSVQGRRHYAFINTFPDEVAQAVLAMTQPEQKYIRLVLQNLVDETESTKATLLNLKDKILTLPQAEALFDKLVDDKWIVWVDPRKTNANGSKVKLAPRTFLELPYMLVDDFGMDKEDLPQMIYHID
jgi:hypothetical protein